MSAQHTKGPWKCIPRELGFEIVAEDGTVLLGSRFVFPGRQEEMLANGKLMAELPGLLEALQFYADGGHFVKHDADAWDTVSGEPLNLYEDESNTATVEDGSIARAAIAKATSQQGGAA